MQQSRCKLCKEYTPNPVGICSPCLDTLRDIVLAVKKVPEEAAKDKTITTRLAEKWLKELNGDMTNITITNCLEKGDYIITNNDLYERDIVVESPQGKKTLKYGEKYVYSNYPKEESVKSPTEGLMSHIKEPLLEGVEILEFKNKIVWGVNNLLKEITPIAYVQDYRKMTDMGYKFFSTREAAESYIEENKPKYTKKQFSEIMEQLELYNHYHLGTCGEGATPQSETIKKNMKIGFDQCIIKIKNLLKP